MKAAPIVVGTDFSPESEVALECARSLALTAQRELIITHAVPLPVAPVSEGIATRWAPIQRDVREASSGRLEALRDEVAAGGIDARIELWDGEAESVLGEVAAKAGAWVIVVGTHGYTGFRRLLLGSVAQKTVRRAPCDVLVAREPIPEGGYRRLLVPIDFSEHSRLAVHRALELAHEGAHIALLHAWELPLLFPHGELGVAALSDELRDDTRIEIQRRGDEWVERYRRPNLELTFVETLGRPSRVIHDRLEKGDYDVLVMGASGHGRVHHWLLGSIAEDALRHSEISVWLAREPSDDVGA